MVMLNLAAAQGIGIQSSLLTPEQVRNAILFGWVNQILALVAIGLGKVVIVLFLLQIHGYNTPSRTVFLWFIAGSSLAVNVISAVLILFQCSPSRKLWDEDTPGTCGGRKRSPGIFDHD
ncbi:hypothetical protein N7520_007170 [Penicillium odoratum]|uniref:uncharacterized protein n=1 Tax=Penicillium odoratum TaxID=1167516 RepID=UPI0025488110|nr:uncharacterized protein N7520_007170 [Penicillium odoratum]KAJ5760014.1 hypothetical protein N7520_007170 [Penicillium odoratum]